MTRAFWWLSTVRGSLHKEARRESARWAAHPALGTSCKPRLDDTEQIMHPVNQLQRRVGKGNNDSDDSDTSPVVVAKKKKKRRLVRKSQVEEEASEERREDACKLPRVALAGGKRVRHRKECEGGDGFGLLLGPLLEEPESRSSQSNPDGNTFHRAVEHKQVVSAAALNSSTLGILAARKGCEIKMAKRHQTKRCDVCTWEVPQIGDYYVERVKRRTRLRSYYVEQTTPEDGHCEIPIKYCLECFKKEVGFSGKFMSTLDEKLGEEDVAKPSVSHPAQTLDMTDVLEEPDYD